MRNSREPTEITGCFSHDIPIAQLGGGLEFHQSGRRQTEPLVSLVSPTANSPKKQSNSEDATEHWQPYAHMQMNAWVQTCGHVPVCNPRNSHTYGLVHAHAKTNTLIHTCTLRAYSLCSNFYCFLTAKPMIHVYCESLPICQENTICGSSGNECDASVETLLSPYLAPPQTPRL